MTPVLSGTIKDGPETIGAPEGGAALATAQRTVSGNTGGALIGCGAADCPSANGLASGAAESRTGVRMSPTLSAIRAKHLQDIVVRRDGTPYNSAAPFTNRRSPNNRRPEF